MNEALCAIVCCFGKENVIVAIVQLYDDGIPGVLGLVDADLDRVIGNIRMHEGLIYSRYHDFDADVVLSDACARYLAETAQAEKLEAFGTAHDFIDDLLIKLKPIAAMKLANERENLGYSFKQLRLDVFFDGATVDVQRLVDSVSQGRFSSGAFKARLMARITHFNSLAFDLKQATSGHDLCAAIGICLRDVLGARLPPQTWGSEVELHFRLAYGRADFEKDPVFNRIRSWEEQNPPFRILN